MPPNSTIPILLAAIFVAVITLQPMMTTHAIPLVSDNKNEPNNLVGIVPERAEELTGTVIDKDAIPKIPQVAAGKIPGHYIIVFKDHITNPEEAANSIAKAHGLKIGLVYSHALKGFSAPIPEKTLEKIQNHPSIKFIEEDKIFKAFDAQVPLNTLQILPISNTQTVPTGVNRVDVDKNTILSISGQRVNTDIAIIDTGIDRNHADLNVIRGATCFGAGLLGGSDDNGHGTHVAGIAAAKNNNFGVVGVAPGANLWAIKVLNAAGTGSLSCVIAGVDYVTAYASQIEVANMSLGCKCQSQALKEAIARSVDTGIVYVVAAGNDGEDASSFEPANYSLDIDGVLTISAIADSDGRCGSLGPSTSSGSDDNLASFSNFGEPITLAAPGVNIRSTYLFGTYTTLSGTSMATPHVTGAVALLVDSQSTLSPGEVKQVLLQNGVSQTKQCNVGLDDGNGGFSGDSDGFEEPMLYAANLS